MLFDSGSNKLSRAETGKMVWSGRWGLFFRVAVTLLTIGYLAFKIHWPELITLLARADFSWLMLACLLFGVNYVLAGIRWWFLMQVQEIRLPLRVVTALTFIGQFFNSFMLGAVGGDIIKAVYMQKYVPRQKTHATLSIIMDRVVGLFVLLCCSLLTLPWQLRSLVESHEGDLAVLGLLVLFGLMVGVAFALAFTPFHRAPNSIRVLWQRVPHRHVIELVVSGFRQHRTARKLTLRGLVAGVALTIVLVAAGYCVAIGIRLNVTYLQMLVIMTVVICVISLPISIGGHGVREGVFVIMFAAFGVIDVNRQTGVGQEPAVLFSLLFFTIPLFWSLIGGIVYLTFRHDYGRSGIAGT
jgi:glycosyltransferase 2 family protein